MLTTFIIIGSALAALIYGAVAIVSILRLPDGNDKMKEIALAIQTGAKAFLNRQYKSVALVAVVLFLIIGFIPALGWLTAIAFLVGAILSALTGYIGMFVSVRANVRTTEAARSGLAKALKVAVRGGSVTGMLVVGLALLGTAGFYFITKDLNALIGFAFGSSLISMFMRVGGGIFTKAADVGADLVGKVEVGIPEDDPRNAATIADNVGDNVGDCAGMAADLFESYAVTLVAALILGKAAFGEQGLVFPLIVPAIGALTAILGVYITKPRVGENGLKAINRGFYISAAVSAVLAAVAAFIYLPAKFSDLVGVSQAIKDLDGNPAAQPAIEPAKLFFLTLTPQIAATLAVFIGIALAGVILMLTGHFTGTDKRPTMDVARTSLTGAATVVLSGIGVGLESAVYTTVIIASAVYLAFLIGGGSVVLSLFLIALAGCGLLTTVGVIVAMDTFGPVSDNAQGIAEMSGDVHGDGVQVLTELDAVGNTTKAITKGIGIATAVLAATALFGSYTDAWQTEVRRIVDAGLKEQPSNFVQSMFDLQIVTPSTLVGLLIGSSVVFLFSGLAINAVTRAAGAIVFEVRRQFREHPGIMDYTEKPEYGKVVDICTKDSLRELATPGLLAALMPVVVGFGLGIGPLAGFLAGAIGTGALMAVFLANAGGSWDNAKKIVEDGAHGGKGSAAHEATIIGDTVGDPFKDTAGPAINPLIKVMNLVSLLIAPAIVALTIGDGANKAIRLGIALVALAIVIGAVVVSRSREIGIGLDVDGDGDGDPEPAEAPTPASV